ncbi:MAG: hypothetical protein ACI8YC_001647 [Salibacteraceae bacterium]|jgi:hypothetical protein|tara:strand:+ start:667 stop:1125 length:459 start_codon:yes stop_codon:yes gene_type:complete
MIKILISFLIQTLFLGAFSQVPSNNSEKRTIEKNESYEVISDKRLKELENRIITINENKKTIEGYRLQLFSSSGPNSFNQANEVQTQFLIIYNDVPAYVVHKKPAFKVRVGDFRTRLETERFFIELRENFPDAFIVKDDINLPRLNSEETKK